MPIPPPKLDPPACLWCFQIVSYIQVMNKDIFYDNPVKKKSQHMSGEITGVYSKYLRTNCSDKTESESMW